ncbi:MAG TPA: bifunctional pyr operon transcriptional regulator/uracil phosphoribosyltransferase PyrR [Acholeplasma sp.]|jgi:pyrimidine operon attenuation protein/uracil phosphoribosyltransferase|nr:bifunctional pyr operon transcriptional regulator/uracil phosphoribosyltransferase PyrR [Acholeplasma sp.]
MEVTMKEIMDKDQLSRTLKRIAHEIIERNDDLSNLILVGILNKGYSVAKILQGNIHRFSDVEVPLYAIDITNYRDDLKQNNDQKNTFDSTGKNVLLIDDVLFTGRTVRAAMDALIDTGRPSKIELAVLIDRGHRELPIRADFVGKNIPTSKDEKVYFDVNEMKVYF